MELELRRKRMFSFRVSDEIELKILEIRHAEEVWSQVCLNREHLAQWLT
jgi:ribosomal-protein-serine acetyltransferase